MPLVVGLMALAGLAVFGPLVGSPFLWDDKTLIRDSPLLARGELGPALKSDFWALSANPRQSGMYRPVVTLTYFVDRAVFGTSPRGPHLINLLLHLAAVLLLARLARTLPGVEPPTAALVAALFAFHPATVEAVANVASRTDVLATVLLLGALVIARAETLTTGRLVGAGALVVLAQLSKEVAFVAVALVLVVEAMAGPLQRARVLRLAATFVAASLVTLVLRRVVLGTFFGGPSSAEWVPVSSGASGAVRYLALAAWPSPLVAYQPATTANLWSIAVVVLLIAAAVVLWRRTTLPALGLAWFLVATSLVAGWLPTEVRFSGLLLYLPLVGVALAVGLGLSRLKPLVAWAIPVAWAVMAFTVALSWRSDATLWQANVDAWPELAAPRLNLANALAEVKSPDAVPQYEAAIRLAKETRDGKTWSMAELGLGNLLLPGEPAAAEPHFRAAREASGGRLWQAGLNLAVALVRQGRSDEAAQVMEAQWAVTPVPPLAALGLKLAEERKSEEELARWRSRVR